MTNNNAVYNYKNMKKKNHHQIYSIENRAGHRGPWVYIPNQLYKSDARKKHRKKNLYFSSHNIFRRYIYIIERVVCIIGLVNTYILVDICGLFSCSCLPEYVENRIAFFYGAPAKFIGNWILWFMLYLKQVINRRMYCSYVQFIYVSLTKLAIGNMYHTICQNKSTKWIEMIESSVIQ